MIFELDEDSKKIIATIQRNDNAEKYECSLLACDNPVCVCETIYLNLAPLRDENKEDYLLSSQSVDIDISEKKLGYPDRKKIPKDDLAFAEFFLSKLDDSNYQFMHERHFVYKNIHRIDQCFLSV